MKFNVLTCSVVVVMLCATIPSAMASTTRYVNGATGSDTNNPCVSSAAPCKTIGHAISISSSGDTIRVAAATYLENLTIGFSLKLIGSSATSTIIDGGGSNGRGPGRVLTISSMTANVTLANFTIRHGCCPSGSLHGGGGIYNVGTLRIDKSTVSGNQSGTGLFQGYAGGIENEGILTITNSTITANVSHAGEFGTPGAGGGIGNGGVLTITNSTISGNSARIGGAIYSCCSAPVMISNSTISANSAFGTGGIMGPATLQNSVVANNSGGNCSGTMTSRGFNLSSDTTCDFDGTNDLNNTNPLLGVLGFYGGPTPTIPLLSGSPAIDSGNPNGCTDGQGNLLKTDQRGKPRPDSEDTRGCDSGAYESQGIK